MAYRKIQDTDFVGKPPIKRVDATAVNVVKIIFDDDSTLELWAETAIQTPYGDIPGIFVDD